MVERILVQGNDAVGWGALMAGCQGYFGYPITPQNEIPTFFAREMPKRGRIFVQSQSEVASINMLQGGSATGARVMTSTSSPGWGLMQEGMSNLASSELPCVIVQVQRGGPGEGTTQHSQMDYLSVTRGGGGGGYKNIVLAPASVQETHDLVQLAFYLADKYRNPTVVLSDGLLGMLAESIEIKTLDFGPLPEKDWAATGKANHKDGWPRWVNPTPAMFPKFPYPYDSSYKAHLESLDKKYHLMAESEVRYESYQTEDAALILVAYGYTARTSKEAVDMARTEGLKVGLIRPITLWPFPSEAIRQKALQGCNFLVVEDSLGQMIDDVKLAVEGKTEVQLLGALARHSSTPTGMLLPDRIFEEVKRLL